VPEVGKTPMKALLKKFFRRKPKLQTVWIGWGHIIENATGWVGSGGFTPIEAGSREEAIKVFKERYPLRRVNGTLTIE